MVPFVRARSAVLLAAQGARSLVRFVTASFDAIDIVTVAWLSLFAGLLVFGRQHGETNRLRTFLVPTATVVLARLLYDTRPRGICRAAVILFFVGLVVTRLRLSCF